MKISYNWLKQYTDCDLTDTEAANKLTLTGLEVEEIESTGTDFNNFVVGYVKNVRNHPNADKLQVCDVDNGNEVVQIVCGAKNVAAGQYVPVAKTGATIPVPMKDGSYLTIKKMKLRGESSNGMICSESELGISDDHSGIMVFEEEFEPGTPLRTVIGSTKDTVFDIGLTPNRPDAACHIGVARDLAAVTKQPLNSPYSSIKTDESEIEDSVTVSVLDTEKCPRYAGIVVENVTVKESPEWLKKRLSSIGLRPINNVVDVTNFILHEIGQPLHAFDYNLIRGNKIEVKTFNKEVKFTTLDSVERTVPADSLFICDGEGPVAIAGIMGGENSEVSETTTKVLIESAYFQPSGIRKTSKLLALQTDSSYRFERGIDPTIQLKAAQRAAELIAELAGGDIVKGSVDVSSVTPEKVEVELRISRLNKLLGTNLTSDTAASILSALEFEILSKSDDSVKCLVPHFRPDVTREVDLIEEVGRIYDYNNIPRPESAPFVTPSPLSENEVFYQRVKSLAKSLRYKEISTNSLLSKKQASVLTDESLHVDTLNPVSQENTTLRTTLAAGFLNAVSYNLNRSENHLRFFEIGHVFANDQNGTWIDGIKEHNHLLLGITGKREQLGWKTDQQDYTAFDLKSDVESLFKSLNILNDVSSEVNNERELEYHLGDHKIGVIRLMPDHVLKAFDIGQDVYVAEIDLTILLAHNAAGGNNSYTPIVKFPVFEFDAAFTLDKNVRAGDVTKEIRNSAGKQLKSVSVFDIYEDEKLGKDKKSIAFRLSFLDSDKTLTISDVEPLVQKIVDSLKKNFGATLRA
jgi:phenylalanyl-tRNA synthetase beta chain